MTYTVIWSPPADARLAELWLAGADRAEITRASHEIDSALRGDPYGAGESRGGGNRIILRPPLGVFYYVNESDRQVVVWAVWHCRKGPPA